MGYAEYAKARDERGFTDYKVSKIAGVGQSTFSDWKSGKSSPKMDKLEKIANALGVPVEVITIGRYPQTGYKPPTPEDSNVIRMQHIQRIADAWNLSPADEEFLQEMVLKPELLGKVRRIYEMMQDAQ